MSRPPAKMIFAAVLVLISSVLAFMHGSVRAAAEAEPAVNWSFYVNTTIPGTLFNLGCNQAKSDWTYKVNSEVVLDFGGQESNGTTFYDNAIPITFTNGQVRTLTDDFATGYWDCSPVGATTQLRLAMGTCNCVDGVGEPNGVTFGGLVEDSELDVRNAGYASQINVWGANDIETWGGGRAIDAQQWETGYQTATPQDYLNYGSLNGCPPYGSCTGNGWNQSVYYALSWGDSPAYPLPEIYYSTQAMQWVNLDQNVGSKAIGFTGPLDEYDLKSGTLSPYWAWQDLEGGLVSCGCNSYMPYQAELHVD